MSTPPIRLDGQTKYAVLARGEAQVFTRLPRAGYMENIWDHAAGALLMEEAGGRVSDLNGDALDFSQGAWRVEADARKGHELDTSLVLIDRQGALALLQAKHVLEPLIGRAPLRSVLVARSPFLQSSPIHPSSAPSALARPHAPGLCSLAFPERAW